MTETAQPKIVPLLIVGVAAGLLSGMFGVGGGTIIVPALVLILGMGQKISAGTSVAAILPTAVIGSISYAVQGNVDWAAALYLAIGIIVGAQVGSKLLVKLPVKFVQWTFMSFLLVVIVSLWFVVPQRDAEITISVLTAVFLMLTGFVTGVLSGLLGVGGGVIVVPILMFFFGSSDLIAKGTSLLMMIPGSLSATVGNTRSGNVDFRAALIIGLGASVTVPLGSLIAAWVDPFWGNVAFSLYLVYILGQMLWRKLLK